MLFAKKSPRLMQYSQSGRALTLDNKRSKLPGSRSTKAFQVGTTLLTLATCPPGCRFSGF
jgi:hypothetical protein